ncbi:MAG: hypothetical protein D6B27_12380 [Gammaproteobacteria bacterium]|nr:MAG: hypothetical protein D6B27_12380 [Gammaproteobacteria bacterium]
MTKPKGKILKYKSGYNPNSSSIGTNLTPLLLGGAVISMFIPVISLFVARRLRKKNKIDLLKNNEDTDIDSKEKESD